MTRRASAAQLRARREFARRARAGTLCKGSKLKSKRVRASTRRVSKRKVRKMGKRKGKSGGGRRMGISVAKIARSTAALTGAAVLLAEPIKIAVAPGSLAGKIDGVAGALIAMPPGKYVAALMPSITVEAALAGRRLLRRAITG